jgi:hypothetical protein
MKEHSASKAWFYLALARSFSGEQLRWTSSWTTTFLHEHKLLPAFFFLLSD